MDQEYIKTVAQVKGMSPVHPFSPESQVSGISYREWLIGMALSGTVQSIPVLEDIEPCEIEAIVDAVILLADRTLARLTEEAIARQEEVQ